MLKQMIENAAFEVATQVRAVEDSLDATLAEKARKQKEYEQRTDPSRRLSPSQLELYERQYPANLRQPDENEAIYAEKRARGAKRIPLLDVAVDLMPCLKPEAIARMACGFVAEAGVNYMGKNYDVRYVRYWFDEATGRVYCLVEAPSPELAHQVHREAHGLVADELVQVQEGA